MQRLFSLVVVASCWCSALLADVSLAGRELSVIVHKASPAQSLSVEEARVYYLKKQLAWSDGTKVRPVEQSGDVRDGFVKRTLGMSVTEYQRYWLELKYSAAESPPKQVEDDADVVRFVGAMKGAIGFVDSESLDPAALGKVKVVLRTGY
jgi:ABC-type phosphate transport system substrate-binding protein